MGHIILVEPDRLLAESYAQALKHDGHTVVPCASAQAAIMAADQQTPDMVVLELQLIQHSGIEFLYEFRSYPEWQNIPVIIQSHVPAGEFAGNWQTFRRELGVTGYLYKPLASLNNLLTSVRRSIVVPEAA